VTFFSDGNTNPALALTYAIGDGSDPYKNYVGYDAKLHPGERGVVFDTPDSTGVKFIPINVMSTPLDIAEYGDANADGYINTHCCPVNFY